MDCDPPPIASMYHGYQTAPMARHHLPHHATVYPMNPASAVGAMIHCRPTSLPFLHPQHHPYQPIQSQPPRSLHSLHNHPPPPVQQPVARVPPSHSNRTKQEQDDMIGVCIGQSPVAINITWSNCIKCRWDDSYFFPCENRITVIFLQEESL